MNYTVKQHNKVEIMWSRFAQILNDIAYLQIQNTANEEIGTYSSLEDAAAEMKWATIKFFTVELAANPAENGIFIKRAGNDLDPDGVNVVNLDGTTAYQLIRFV